MDLVITGGLVVAPGGPVEADLGIEDGRIAGLFAPGCAPAGARRHIDATGLQILPGAVDLHTHFTGSNDDPAGELREGTLGAAIGGITTVVEMPHSDPPATSVASFTAKRALIGRTSTIDFAMWAGLDNRNLDQLAGLDAEGAVAFKAFTTSGDPSGAAPDHKGLPRIDDGFLLDAMREIARFDGLIGIHSENHEILARARARLVAEGRNDMLAHAESGPEIAEIEAVSRVIAFARESGARTHVVHVSSARAAALIAGAHSGARITYETCPHYLALDQDDLVRIGPDARCGPPLRPRATVDALWAEVLAGRADALASDHCPYRPQDKQAGRDSIWLAGMGLTGAETLGPVFYSEAVVARGMELGEFARMTAEGPARIAGLPAKGAIRIGADADLALYDPKSRWTVRGERFHGLATWSAFEGREVQGRVALTLSRGEIVQDMGDRRREAGSGRFVTRSRGGSSAGGK